MGFRGVTRALMLLLLPAGGTTWQPISLRPLCRGRARVYQRGPQAEWRTQAFLMGDPIPEDYFGCSVAIAGDTAVVDTCRSGEGDGNDYAYVFERSGDYWTRTQVLSRPAGGGHLSLAPTQDLLALGGAVRDPEPRWSVYLFEKR